jgi:hypothetical protein
MKVYEKVEIQLLAFLTLSLRAGERPASRSSRFELRKNNEDGWASESVWTRTINITNFTQ